MVFRRDWVVMVQRDMERLLEDLSRRKPPSYFYPAPWQLPLDVYETPNEVIVLAELAGVSRDGLEIIADSSALTIRGERQDPTFNRQEGVFCQKCCHQLEIYWGPFERTISLPTTIDPDQTSATFQDGVLEVRLPKASSEKPYRIKVKG